MKWYEKDGTVIDQDPIHKEWAEKRQQFWEEANFIPLSDMPPVTILLSKRDGERFLELMDREPSQYLKDAMKKHGRKYLKRGRKSRKCGCNHKSLSKDEK